MKIGSLLMLHLHYAHHACAFICVFGAYVLKVLYSPQSALTPPSELMAQLCVSVFLFSLHF